MSPPSWGWFLYILGFLTALSLALVGGVTAYRLGHHAGREVLATQIATQERAMARLGEEIVKLNQDIGSGAACIRRGIR